MSVSPIYFLFWLTVTSKTIPLYPGTKMDDNTESENFLVTLPFFLLLIPAPPAKENMIDSVSARRAKIPILNNCAFRFFLIAGSDDLEMV